tara:strand:- start:204 stop:365 length:162 start_codon:yes stop_codon:yes gene_type:complete
MIEVVINISLVCLLSSTAALLMSALTEKNQQSLIDLRSADRKRVIDELYGRSS